MKNSKKHANVVLAVVTALLVCAIIGTTVTISFSNRANIETMQEELFSGYTRETLLVLMLDEAVDAMLNAEASGTVSSMSDCQALLDELQFQCAEYDVFGVGDPTQYARDLAMPDGSARIIRKAFGRNADPSSSCYLEDALQLADTTLPELSDTQLFEVLPFRISTAIETRRWTEHRTWEISNAKLLLEYSGGEDYVAHLVLYDAEFSIVG